MAMDLPPLFGIEGYDLAELKAFPFTLRVPPAQAFQLIVDTPPSVLEFRFSRQKFPLLGFGPFDGGAEPRNFVFVPAHSAARLAGSSPASLSDGRRTITARSGGMIASVRMAERVSPPMTTEPRPR